MLISTVSTRPEARIASNGTDFFVVWDPPGPTLLGSPMTADGTPFEGVGVQPDEPVDGGYLDAFIRALELLREKTKG